MDKKFEFYLFQYGINYLDQLIINRKIAKELKSIISGKQLPLSYCFYGPAGSGKLTLIRSLMVELYDLDISRQLFTLSDENSYKNILTSGKFYLANDYVSDSDLLEFLRDMSKHDISNNHFIPIIITHIEKRSQKIQKMVRTLIDNTNFRIIMTARGISCLSSEIKSRVGLIRIPSPEESEITSFLKKISQKHKVSLTRSDYKKIVTRNIATSILNYHQYIIKGKNFTQSDLNYTIKTILNIIIGGNLSDIFQVRQYLLKICGNNCDPTKVITVATKLLTGTKLPDETKIEIVQHASEKESCLPNTNNDYYVLEAFFFQLLKIINKNMFKKK